MPSHDAAGVQALGSGGAAAMISAVRWYDRVARVLDIASLDAFFYRTARAYAIERLAPSQGDVVLDLFCGSGVNFPLLRERVGPEGRIVGVDGSAGMLRRARAVADGLVGGTGSLLLLRADLSTEEGATRVMDAVSQFGATRFLVTLGLTCLPNWREFFRSVYEAAPDRARFAILDVHCERPGPGARLISWTAAADCSRPVWRELEDRAADFELRIYSPFRIIDAAVIVASGTKAD